MSTEYSREYIISRHAKKNKSGNGITPKGVRLTQEAVQKAYKERPDLKYVHMVLISMGSLDRCIQTAGVIRTQIIELSEEDATHQWKPTDMLSEGAFTEYVEWYKEKYGKEGWTKYYLEGGEIPQKFANTLKIPDRMVDDFWSWFNEQERLCKTLIGDYKIFAVTHGPVMLAVLTDLEKRFEFRLIDDIPNLDDIFKAGGQLGPLATITIAIDSSHTLPLLTFDEKKVELPIIF